MSFLNIVKNYNQLGKLGSEIMRHKEVMGNYPKSFNYDKEFEKQHLKIEQFLELQKKTEIEARSVDYLINEYWTGWD